MYRNRRTRMTREQEELLWEKLTEELDDIAIPGEAHLGSAGIHVERVGPESFYVYDGAFASKLVDLEEAARLVDELQDDAAADAAEDRYLAEHGL